MKSNPESPLSKLLVNMPTEEASDLHIVPGYRPMYRVHGDLRNAGDNPLTSEEISALLRPLLPPTAAARFDTDRDIDLALQIPGPSGQLRFRVNVFTDRGGRGACFPS